MAGVAHEINNPLGTIILYSSLLKKQLLRVQEDGQNAEDLDLIMSEANRCKNIVANLLNFARQGKLNITKVDLADLLEEIVKTIKVNPLYTNIEINLDVQTSSSVIDGDEDQLKQVFLNIINNACEALEELEEGCSKTVEVKIKWENDSLVTEIKDNGPGIQKENVNKVFTPFLLLKKLVKVRGLDWLLLTGLSKCTRDLFHFKAAREGNEFYR